MPNVVVFRGDVIVEMEAVLVNNVELGCVGVKGNDEVDSVSEVMSGLVVLFV